MTNPRDAIIASFDQFDHLAELQRFVHAHRELEAAIGRDYLVTPDIVIGRRPVEDDEINVAEELIAPGDRVAELSALRVANGRRPILHASISCKWTMRSDRAQNTRTEALNLIRNRKGRTPHVVAVTLEPLPGRIASIAMGTGDVDCTYHAALHELLVAAADSDFQDAYELLQISSTVAGCGTSATCRLISLPDRSASAHSCGRHLHQSGRRLLSRPGRLFESATLL